ncbi:MAG: hypothetical protein K9N47_28725 [Prosthecobacter sp.]|uniref:hypothetical protein n=1 Tax=Prosthecobacter sp. TaxID=1965333 RepID=UPI00261062A1|nr:hypothetical protein [Prosthecobacter sp.]MCF7790137.1 hypothetical protein [Prosthecobacter sp.]
MARGNTIGLVTYRPKTTPAAAMHDNNPDHLDDLLAEWQPQVETPPDFRREVWRRIAVESINPGLIERFSWWLMQPKREIAIMTAAVVLAVVWGVTHPPEATSPHDAYLTSISPFDVNHHSLGRP